MTTLLSPGTSQIYEKIILFSEYDPTQYQDDPQYSWITSESLQAYLDQCTSILQGRYDDIAGGLASIDKDDDESIPLAEERIEDDTFVMQPEDVSVYMTNGLSFEYDITDALLSQTMVFGNTTIQTDDAGNNITMIFESDLPNPDQITTYPFTNLHLILRITMEYIASGRYDATYAEFIVTYTDLYRGPQDNVGDRGANYYDKILATATYFEPVSGNPSTRYVKSGSLWSLNKTESNSVDYTLDNGSSGQIDFDFAFTTTSALTKFVGGEIVDSNNSDANFTGSLTMPKYQWSEFTKTQSPNILREIDSLYTEVNSPQTDLFVSGIIDSITEVWPGVIDALPNGENYSMEDILEDLEARLNSSKAISEAENIESITKIAKTYLASGVFVEGANYALAQLGIDSVAKINMTISELSDLNDELIDIGITDFEETEGYYNWANVPEANPMDECSRFATAIFDRVNSFSEMESHPAITWISNNFDFIEGELLTAENELKEVI
jgi:hypothetical protein